MHRYKHRIVGGGMTADAAGDLAARGAAKNNENALQHKSLQSLIFTQSGRRDLNPRPPEAEPARPRRRSGRGRAG
jgi:hypothetical protein